MRLSRRTGGVDLAEQEGVTTAHVYRLLPP
jgi:hypothetical protein